MRVANAVLQTAPQFRKALTEQIGSPPLFTSSNSIHWKSESRAAAALITSSNTALIGGMGAVSSTRFIVFQEEGSSAPAPERRPDRRSPDRAGFRRGHGQPATARL